MNIIDVATLINPQLTGLDTLCQRYQWGERNQKIFSRFMQLESACLFPQQSLSQLLSECLCRLLQAHPHKRGQIRYVIHAHSLHHVSPLESGMLQQLVAAQLGPDVEVLSATQNSCASSFNALALLQSLLGAAGGRQPQYAVLLTGDKCFHQTVQYVNQNGVFGEGCSALLLTTDATQPGCVVSGIGRAMIGGMGTRTAATSREAENRFDHAFMPTLMRAVERALCAAQIEPEQLDAILPWHMSPATFDRIADRLAIPRTRIMRDNLYRLGHCFCGDAFINLHDYRCNTQNPVQGHLLAMAAGVAGSFSAMVLRRNDGETTA